MKNFFINGRKLIAMVTLFTFSATNFSYSQDLSVANGKPEMAMPLSLGLVQAAGIQVPEKLATLDLFHAGKDKTIFHIQNAHGNYQGEKQTEALLTFLKQKYGVETILAEGAWNKLNPELIRFDADSKKNADILDKLTKNAIIKGFETHLLDSPKSTGYGIEEEALYNQGLKAFAEVQVGRSKHANELAALETALEARQTKIFSSDLRALVKRIEKYCLNEIPFENYLHELKNLTQKYFRLDLGDVTLQNLYPQLVRIYKIEELEKKIDSTAFAQEKEMFLTLTKPYLNSNVIPAKAGIQSRSGSPGATTGFPRGDAERGSVSGVTSGKWGGNEAAEQVSVYQQVEQLLNLKDLSANLPDPATAEFFIQMVQMLPANFDYKKFENVTTFFGLLILRSEIHADRLMQEIDRLETELMNQLATTDEAKALVTELKDHWLFEKLIKLELTPSEFEKIQTTTIDHRLLTIDQNRAVIASQSKSARLPAGRKQSEFVIPAQAGIQSIVQSALEFYKIARERDAVMLKRIEERLQETKADKVAVITGGFHSGPFADYFKKRGYSYAKITPRLTEFNESDRENYVNVMMMFAKANRATSHEPRATKRGASPGVAAASPGVAQPVSSSVIASQSKSARLPAGRKQSASVILAEAGIHSSQTSQQMTESMLNRAGARAAVAPLVVELDIPAGPVLANRGLTPGVFRPTFSSPRSKSRGTNFARSETRITAQQLVDIFIRATRMFLEKHSQQRFSKNLGLGINLSEINIDFEAIANIVNATIEEEKLSDWAFALSESDLDGKMTNIEVTLEMELGIALDAHFHGKMHDLSDAYKVASVFFDTRTMASTTKKALHPFEHPADWARAQEFVEVVHGVTSGKPDWRGVLSGSQEAWFRGESDIILELTQTIQQLPDQLSVLGQDFQFKEMKEVVIDRIGKIQGHDIQAHVLINMRMVSFYERLEEAIAAIKETGKRKRAGSVVLAAGLAPIQDVIKRLKDIWPPRSEMRTLQSDGEGENFVRGEARPTWIDRVNVFANASAGEWDDLLEAQFASALEAETLPDVTGMEMKIAQLAFGYLKQYSTRNSLVTTSSTHYVFLHRPYFIMLAYLIWLFEKKQPRSYEVLQKLMQTFQAQSNRPSAPAKFIVGGREDTVEAEFTILKRTRFDLAGPLDMKVGRLGAVFDQRVSLATGRIYVGGGQETVGVPVGGKFYFKLFGKLWVLRLGWNKIWLKNFGRGVPYALGSNLFLIHTDENNLSVKVTLLNLQGKELPIALPDVDRMPTDLVLLILQAYFYPVEASADKAASLKLSDDAVSAVRSEARITPDELGTIVMEAMSNALAQEIQNQLGGASGKPIEVKALPLLQALQDKQVSWTIFADQINGQIGNLDESAQQVLIDLLPEQLEELFENVFERGIASGALRDDADLYKIVSATLKEELFEIVNRMVQEPFDAKEISAMIAAASTAGNHGSLDIDPVKADIFSRIQIQKINTLLDKLPAALKDESLKSPLRPVDLADLKINFGFDKEPWSIAFSDISGRIEKFEARIKRARGRFAGKQTELDRVEGIIEEIKGINKQILRVYRSELRETRNQGSVIRGQTSEISNQRLELSDGITSHASRLPAAAGFTESEARSEFRKWLKRAIQISLIVAVGWSVYWVWKEKQRDDRARGLARSESVITDFRTKLEYLLNLIDHLGPNVEGMTETGDWKNLLGAGLLSPHHVAIRFDTQSSPIKQAILDKLPQGTPTRVRSLFVKTQALGIIVVSGENLPIVVKPEDRKFLDDLFERLGTPPYDPATLEGRNNIIKALRKYQRDGINPWQAPNSVQRSEFAERATRHEPRATPARRGGKSARAEARVRSEARTDEQSGDFLASVVARKKVLMQTDREEYFQPDEDFTGWIDEIISHANDQPHLLDLLKVMDLTTATHYPSDDREGIFAWALKNREVEGWGRARHAFEDLMARKVLTPELIEFLAWDSQAPNYLTVRIRNAVFDRIFTFLMPLINPFDEGLQSDFEDLESFLSRFQKEVLPLVNNTDALFDYLGANPGFEQMPVMYDGFWQDTKKQTAAKAGMLENRIIFVRADDTFRRSLLAAEKVSGVFHPGGDFRYLVIMTPAKKAVGQVAENRRAFDLLGTMAHEAAHALQIDNETYDSGFGKVFIEGFQFIMEYLILKQWSDLNNKFGRKVKAIIEAGIEARKDQLHTDKLAGDAEKLVAAIFRTNPASKNKPKPQARLIQEIPGDDLANFITAESFYARERLFVLRILRKIGVQDWREIRSARHSAASTFYHSGDATLLRALLGETPYNLLVEVLGQNGFEPKEWLPQNSYAYRLALTVANSFSGNELPVETIRERMKVIVRAFREQTGQTALRYEELYSSRLFSALPRGTDVKSFAEAFASSAVVPFLKGEISEAELNARTTTVLKSLKRSELRTTADLDEKPDALSDSLSRSEGRIRHRAEARIVERRLIDQFDRIFGIGTFSKDSITPQQLNFREWFPKTFAAHQVASESSFFASVNKSRLLEMEMRRKGVQPFAARAIAALRAAAADERRSSDSILDVFYQEFFDDEKDSGRRAELAEAILDGGATDIISFKASERRGSAADLTAEEDVHQYDKELRQLLDQAIKNGQTSAAEKEEARELLRKFNEAPSLIEAGVFLNGFEGLFGAARFVRKHQRSEARRIELRSFVVGDLSENVATADGGSREVVRLNSRRVTNITEVVDVIFNKWEKDLAKTDETMPTSVEKVQIGFFKKNGALKDNVIYVAKPGDTVRQSLGKAITELLTTGTPVGGSFVSKVDWLFNRARNIQIILAQDDSEIVQLPPVSVKEPVVRVKPARTLPSKTELFDQLRQVWQRGDYPDRPVMERGDYTTTPEEAAAIRAMTKRALKLYQNNWVHFLEEAGVPALVAGGLKKVISTDETYVKAKSDKEYLKNALLELIKERQESGVAESDTLSLHEMMHYDARSIALLKAAMLHFKYNWPLAVKELLGKEIALPALGSQLTLVPRQIRVDETEAERRWKELRGQVPEQLKAVLGGLEVTRRTSASLFPSALTIQTSEDFLESHEKIEVIAGESNAWMVYATKGNISYEVFFSKNGQRAHLGSVPVRLKEDGTFIEAYAVVADQAEDTDILGKIKTAILEQKEKLFAVRTIPSMDDFLEKLKQVARDETGLTEQYFRVRGIKNVDDLLTQSMTIRGVASRTFDPEKLRAIKLALSKFNLAFGSPLIKKIETREKTTKWVTRARSEARVGKFFGFIFDPAQNISNDPLRWLVRAVYSMLMAIGISWVVRETDFYAFKSDLPWISMEERIERHMNRDASVNGAIRFRMWLESYGISLPSDWRANENERLDKEGQHFLSALGRHLSQQGQKFIRPQLVQDQGGYVMTTGSDETANYPSVNWRVLNFSPFDFNEGGWGLLVATPNVSGYASDSQSLWVIVNENGNLLEKVIQETFEKEFRLRVSNLNLIVSQQNLYGSLDLRTPFLENKIHFSVTDTEGGVWRGIAILKRDGTIHLDRAGNVPMARSEMRINIGEKELSGEALAVWFNELAGKAVQDRRKELLPAQILHFNSLQELVRQMAQTGKISRQSAALARVFVEAHDLGYVLNDFQPIEKELKAMWQLIAEAQGIESLSERERLADETFRYLDRNKDNFAIAKILGHGTTSMVLGYQKLKDLGFTSQQAQGWALLFASHHLGFPISMVEGFQKDKPPAEILPILLISDASRSGEVAANRQRMQIADHAAKLIGISQEEARYLAALFYGLDRITAARKMEAAKKYGLVAGDLANEARRSAPLKPDEFLSLNNVYETAIQRFETEKNAAIQAANNLGQLDLAKMLEEQGNREIDATKLIQDSALQFGGTLAGFKGQLANLFADLQLVRAAKPEEVDREAAEFLLKTLEVISLATLKRSEARRYETVDTQATLSGGVLQTRNEFTDFAEALGGTFEQIRTLLRNETVVPQLSAGSDPAAEVNTLLDKFIVKLSISGARFSSTDTANKFASFDEAKAELLEKVLPDVARAITFLEFSTAYWKGGVVAANLPSAQFDEIQNKIREIASRFQPYRAQPTENAGYDSINSDTPLGIGARLLNPKTGKVYIVSALLWGGRDVRLRRPWSLTSRVFSRNELEVGWKIDITRDPTVVTQKSVVYKRSLLAATGAVFLGALLVMMRQNAPPPEGEAPRSKGNQKEELKAPEPPQEEPAIYRGGWTAGLAALGNYSVHRSEARSGGQALWLPAAGMGTLVGVVASFLLTLTVMDVWARQGLEYEFSGVLMVFVGFAALFSIIGTLISYLMIGAVAAIVGRNDGRNRLGWSTRLSRLWESASNFLKETVWGRSFAAAVAILITLSIPGSTQQEEPPAPATKPSDLPAPATPPATEPATPPDSSPDDRDDEFRPRMFAQRSEARELKLAEAAAQVNALLDTFPEGSPWRDEKYKLMTKGPESYEEANRLTIAMRAIWPKLTSSEFASSVTAGANQTPSIGQQIKAIEEDVFARMINREYGERPETMDIPPELRSEFRVPSLKAAVAIVALWMANVLPSAHANVASPDASAASLAEKFQAEGVANIPAIKAFRDSLIASGVVEVADLMTPIDVRQGVKSADFEGEKLKALVLMTALVTGGIKNAVFVVEGVSDADVEALRKNFEAAVEKLGLKGKLRFNIVGDGSANELAKGITSGGTVVMSSMNAWLNGVSFDGNRAVIHQNVKGLSGAEALLHGWHYLLKPYDNALLELKLMTEIAQHHSAIGDINAAILAATKAAASA